MTPSIVFSSSTNQQVQANQQDPGECDRKAGNAATHRTRALDGAARRRRGVRRRYERDDRRRRRATTIVATTSIWADVAGNIACDGLAEIETVIPIGGDPHSFEPSLQDREVLENADLIVANGLALEESLEDTIDAAEQHGTPVFRFADHMTPLEAGDRRRPSDRRSRGRRSARLVRSDSRGGRAPGIAGRARGTSGARRRSRRRLPRRIPVSDRRHRHRGRSHSWTRSQQIVASWSRTTRRSATSPSTTVSRCSAP